VRYTKLGRTGLDVSVIGIGMEHLRGQSRKTAISVVREAIEHGVNYFDVIFSMPDYLDNMAAAFEGHRDRVLLTAHLGSTERKGQYLKSRSVRQCATFFLDYLRRVGTNYVDILFLHNFNSIGDWEKIVKPGGVLELALHLRQEGKAHVIGISGHYSDPLKAAIESGQVDVVMFPINLFNHAMPGRQELVDLCIQQEIGLVAMKPYGGGKLLNKRGSLRVPKYQTGGEMFKTKITSEITPAQCLSYVQAQVGVSVALPGVKSEAELTAALQALEETEAERDFSRLLTQFGRYQEGECVYCNHCLPCPAIIDIGQVLRMVDLAQWGITRDLQRAYDRLPVPASACTACEVCEKRCPFGVQVVVNMRRAVSLFEPLATVDQVLETASAVATGIG
jgi:predicted aldo/keto reductase-like oxidoreductase